MFLLASLLCVAPPSVFSSSALWLRGQASWSQFLENADGEEKAGQAMSQPGASPRGPWDLGRSFGRCDVHNVRNSPSLSWLFRWLELPSARLGFGLA